MNRLLLCLFISVSLKCGNLVQRDKAFLSRYRQHCLVLNPKVKHSKQYLVGFTKEEPLWLVVDSLTWRHTFSKIPFILLALEKVIWELFALMGMFYHLVFYFFWYSFCSQGTIKLSSFCLDMDTSCSILWAVGDPSLPFVPCPWLYSDCEPSWQPVGTVLSLTVASAVWHRRYLVIDLIILRPHRKS